MAEKSRVKAKSPQKTSKLPQRTVCSKFFNFLGIFMVFLLSGIMKPSCLRSHNRRRQSLVPLKFTEKKNHFSIPKIEITSSEIQSEVEAQSHGQNHMIQ